MKKETKFKRGMSSSGPLSEKLNKSHRKEVEKFKRKVISTSTNTYQSKFVCGELEYGIKNSLVILGIFFDKKT